MEPSDLAMAEDGDLDTQEQVVADSPRVKAGGSQNQTKAISNIDINASDSDSGPKTRTSRKRRKRRHRYRMDDVIREISPQPMDLNNLELNADSQEGSDPHLKPENADTENSDDKEIRAVVLIINGKRMVQCNICKRLMTESRLANHIRLLHVEIKDDENNPKAKRKEFRCETCGKSYGSKYTYDKHIRTHVEGRPKCPDCESTFATAFSLFRHRARVHNLKHNYTTYSCDECDKFFFSESELSLHKRRHSTEKDHKCPECDKAFTVKGNLNIHMRTHAKEKIYRCDICDQSFSHPYSLVCHRRIHTNEFPYSCEKCGKNYRSKHQLTSHLIVHTNQRPFKCEDCGKTFRSRTAFKMHQDQHLGIMRFSCKFCERRFQCHANKLKHERRHIGDKKHKCEKCDKAFIEKQELKNHMKVHDRSLVTPKPKKKEPRKYKY